VSRGVFDTSAPRLPNSQFKAGTSRLKQLHKTVAAVLEDEYGWKEADIRGLLGANLMRAYKANWEN